MERTIKIRRKSGILAHPTSFPSRYGIGDFGEGAYDFVDFLCKSGQGLWQVLPLNHASYGNSPYQCYSSHAGEILLISPDLLIKDGLIDESEIHAIMEETRFSERYSRDYDCMSVDYGAVIDFKKRVFETAYNSFSNLTKNIPDAKYQKFTAENAFWLDEYAFFVAIKERYIKEREKTIDPEEYRAYQKKLKMFQTKTMIDDAFYGGMWNSWEEGLLRRRPETLEKWRKDLAPRIEFNKFLQFKFFEQWSALKAYANENGVEIIGDMPIFVSADSVDVWANSGLFLLDGQLLPNVVSGVPPDYFSKKGQLWGNPLYNWSAHEKEGFDFWITRIKATLNMCDYVRIDHFRGFESYWEIAFGSDDATKGKWVKAPGYKLFDAVKRVLGDVPIIAEDLGIITEDVIKLRDYCGFMGMKVLQFGFDAGRNNLNIPHNFTSSNTIVYTGTHDNDTTVGFYNGATEPIKDQFRRYMNTDATAPHWDLIRLAFLSCAAFAIVPIQDVIGLGSEYRMNTPGEANGCWRFRFKKDMLTDDMARTLVYLADLTDRNIKSESVETDPGDI